DAQHDSREVRIGDLYCAVEGQRFNGHDFIGEALERGAVAICAHHEEAVPEDVPRILVPDVRAALGPLSAKVHGHPSLRLRVYGVTGTNGKTTTTYLLRHVLQAVDRRVDLIGTVERTVGGEAYKSKRTTPEATDLQRWFAQMLEQGTEDVVIEVSSH
ncbi:UDP-N-acetylmuramyl-tripeptide synthetase, partial [mine drainage metagenome]